LNSLIKWDRIMWSSLIFVSILFGVVMFYINPKIDSKNGIGIIELQLSFFTDEGMRIVHDFGIGGAERFKKYILADYIYAVSYVLFFVSILKMLISRKKAYNYNFFIYIAIFAGIFDWVENSIEIAFLSNMKNFSELIFFLHSVVSLLKWTALPIVLFGIYKLTKESR